MNRRFLLGDIHAGPFDSARRVVVPQLGTRLKMGERQLMRFRNLLCCSDDSMKCSAAGHAAYGTLHGLPFASEIDARFIQSI
jgi:hypothetical protein